MPDPPIRRCSSAGPTRRPRLTREDIAILLVVAAIVAALAWVVLASHSEAAVPDLDSGTPRGECDARLWPVDEAAPRA